MLFLRPEVNQLYQLESNRKHSLCNPVVFKSTGKSSLSEHEHPTSDGPAGGENILNVEDDILGPVPTENRPTEVKQVRVYDIRCYICKDKLGPNHSSRICKYTWKITYS